jgi:hypothetical protein
MPRQKKDPVTTDGINFGGLFEPEVYTDDQEPIHDDIISWVEQSFEYWLDHQDRWRTVVLDTEADVTAAVAEARRYCNQVREEPLTFQIKSKGTHDNQLTYRVRESLKRS